MEKLKEDDPDRIKLARLVLGRDFKPPVHGIVTWHTTRRRHHSNGSWSGDYINIGKPSEEGSLNITRGEDTVPNNANFFSMYRPGDVTIACSVVKYADRTVEKPNRGLVRKIADAFLDAFGNRRHGKSFRSRLFD